MINVVCHSYIPQDLLPKYVYYVFRLVEAIIRQAPPFYSQQVFTYKINDIQVLQNTERCIRILQFFQRALDVTL